MNGKNSAIKLDSRPLDDTRLASKRHPAPYMLGSTLCGSEDSPLLRAKARVYELLEVLLMYRLALLLFGLVSIVVVIAAMSLPSNLSYAADIAPSPKPAWTPMKFDHPVVFTIAMDNDPATNGRITVSLANRLAQRREHIIPAARAQCGGKGESGSGSPRVGRARRFDDTERLHRAMRAR